MLIYCNCAIAVAISTIRLHKLFNKTREIHEFVQNMSTRAHLANHTFDNKNNAKMIIKEDVEWIRPSNRRNSRVDASSSNSVFDFIFAVSKRTILCKEN